MCSTSLTYFHISFELHLSTAFNILICHRNFFTDSYLSGTHLKNVGFFLRNCWVLPKLDTFYHSWTFTRLHPGHRPKTTSKCQPTSVFVHHQEIMEYASIIGRKHIIFDGIHNTLLEVINSSSLSKMYTSKRRNAVNLAWSRSVFNINYMEENIDPMFAMLLVLCMEINFDMFWLAVLFASKILLHRLQFSVLQWIMD